MSSVAEAPPDEPGPGESPTAGPSPPPTMIPMLDSRGQPYAAPPGMMPTPPGGILPPSFHPFQSPFGIPPLLTADPFGVMGKGPINPAAAGMCPGLNVPPAAAAAGPAGHIPLQHGAPGGPVMLPQPALIPPIVPGGPPMLLLFVPPAPGQTDARTGQLASPRIAGCIPISNGNAFFQGQGPGAAAAAGMPQMLPLLPHPGAKLPEDRKRGLSPMIPKQHKRRRGEDGEEAFSMDEEEPDPSTTEPLKALLMLLNGNGSKNDPRWPAIAAAAASALPPQLLEKISNLGNQPLDDAASQAVLNHVLQAMLLVSGSVPGGPAATGPGTPDAPSPADVAQVALQYLARARSRPDVIAHLASVTKAAAQAASAGQDPAAAAAAAAAAAQENDAKKEGDIEGTPPPRSRFLEAPLFEEQWNLDSEGGSGESGGEEEEFWARGVERRGMRRGAKREQTEDDKNAAAAAAAAAAVVAGAVGVPPGVGPALWTSIDPAAAAAAAVAATVDDGSLATLLSRTLRGEVAGGKSAIAADIKTHSDLVRGAVEGLRLKEHAEAMEVNFSAKQGQRSATATVFDGCTRAALINKRTLRSAKRDERGLRVRVFPQGLWLRQEVNGELKSPEDVKEPGRRLKPVSQESDLKVAVLIGLAFSRLRILLHPDWVRRELWPETACRGGNVDGDGHDDGGSESN